MSNYPALHLLVGGEQISGDGRDSEDVINPATGEILGRLVHANAADLDRALEGAKKGFREWRQTPADKRAAILTKAAGLIKERAGEIAHHLTLEQGKPLGEAKGETIYAAMLLEWIRRKDARFDKELRDYLFTDKPIVDLEKHHHD